MNGIKYTDTPNRLTINRVTWRPLEYTHDTLFKEVRVVPYMPKQIPVYEMKKGNWKNELFEAICRYVETVPDGVEFACSSGCDSRIILAALIKTGRGFYPIECGGEAREFHKILEVSNEYGISYDPEIKPFSPDRFNGVVGYPMNQWYDYYMTDNLITGYGANITDAMRGRSKRLQSPKGSLQFKIQWYFEWSYYLALNKFRTRGDLFIPFWSDEFIKAACEYQGWRNTKRMSDELARYVLPKATHIRNLKTKDVRALGYRTVESGILAELEREYKSTWFGKRFPHTPSNDIDYNPWWGHFNAARLCEHLIENGYTINT